MKDSIVPPPPLGAIAPTEGTFGQNATAPRKESPLDAAFLGRTYRSMVWFGVVVTTLAAFGWKTTSDLGSFVGGYLLAALLLRVQQVLLTNVLRPREQLSGIDPRLVVALTLPLKFIAVAAVLVAFKMLGFLQPVPVAVGFFAAQTVIIAKFLGWMITRSTVRK